MGIFTGLTPGIHINLVCTLLIAYSAFILKISYPLSISCFVIAMSITHSFLDIIPSVYLGAPDESKALAVLPAHRLLLEGKAHDAIIITLLGSLFSLILMILSIPIFLYLFPLIYLSAQKYIAFLLILMLLIILFQEKDKFSALLVLAISGFLGVLVFKLNMENPLFPMLSGLFGISTLITSLSSNPKVPEQKIENKTYEIFPLQSLIAMFSGSLTTIFPGLGAAHAASIGTKFAREKGTESYLFLLGGIGTVAMASSLISLYTLDKARNGSIIAISHFIQNIDIKIMIALYAAALVSSGISIILSIEISKKIANLINKINYRTLCISIIFFVTSLVIILTGFTGLVVLVVSSVIGLLPEYFKTQKSQCMGCLLIPVILYFL